MAKKKIQFKDALTGGAANALDSIDGAFLVNEASAIVTHGGKVYVYDLNATSGAAESSPNIIAPDANAGDKRWILQKIYVGNLNLDDVDDGATYGKVLLTELSSGKVVKLGTIVADINMGTHKLVALSVPSATGDSVRATAIITEVALESAITDDHTHSNKAELDKVTDGDHDVRVDNPHSVTRTQLSLENVTNDAQVKKLATSTDGNVPTWNGNTGDALSDGYSVETTLSGNSGKLARADAIKNYCDNLLAANDAMIFKGSIDCSANPNYPAADCGHVYKVSIAGKIGGASGPNVEINDSLICSVDSSASGDHATVGANWVIVQNNIDRAVTGPTSATDHAIMRFNGVTGLIAQNSVPTIDDTGNINMQSKVISGLAVPAALGNAIRQTTKITETSLETALDNDIAGPASATDHAIVRFDLATGKIVQNSGVLVNDANAVSGIGALTVNGCGVLQTGSTPSGTAAMEYNGYFYATRCYNPVYSDYADFQKLDDSLMFGKCYAFSPTGLKVTTKRNQRGVVGIASDTFGNSVGKGKDINEVPIAVGGWVLAYVDKEYSAGTPLTCDKNGNLTKVSLIRKILFPERTIAIYEKRETREVWQNTVMVDGRSWVKVI